MTTSASRLLIVLSLVLVACGPRPTTQAAETPATAPSTQAATSPAAPPSLPWGGLEVVQAGVPLADAERVVVLFHGFGAPGDDLVGLAGVLRAGPEAAFVMPAAPHVLENGGRCWRRRDGSGFAEARSAVVDLVAHVHRECPDGTVVVGGFSQGGMIAGSLLAEGWPYLEGAILFSPSTEAEPRPLPSSPAPVLIAHGRSDRIVPFSEAEALRVRLEGGGCAVTWHPFEGGHSIPGSALGAANQFLAGLGTTGS
ncbi:MAG: dienelactone hydrolase family protein [Acidobacteriota bacterium]